MAIRSGGFISPQGMAPWTNHNVWIIAFVSVRPGSSSMAKISLFNHRLANEALKINPNYAGAHYNLGKIAANQGKIEDAILHYKKTLQVSPNMAEALYNLSWIYATNEKFRSGENAVRLAEKLCELQDYNQPLSLDALAAAYAEAGRFKEAVLTAQKGLELAQKMGPKELVPGLENRLKLYQAGGTYRQIQSKQGNN